MVPRAARQEQRCCRKAQPSPLAYGIENQKLDKILNIDIISNIDSVISGDREMPKHIQQKRAIRWLQIAWGGELSPKYFAPTLPLALFQIQCYNRVNQNYKVGCENKHMMKVFICPECGSITTVSRRKEIYCHKCGGTKMLPSKLTFSQYSEMDEQQRKDYSESWLYIRNKTKN